MQVNKIRFRYYAAAAGVLLSVASINANAQSDNQAWVTDELSTYVRSGPTDGYRIIGTLNAGEQVDVLETSGNYTRVRNSDGNAVWVLSDELQQTPSAVEQIPALEAQVEEDLLMRYFMYGGGVAGAGLLVGLIVPHLPRRRKKRDRWF